MKPLMKQWRTEGVKQDWKYNGNEGIKKLGNEGKKGVYWWRLNKVEYTKRI